MSLAFDRQLKETIRRFEEAIASLRLLAATNPIPGQIKILANTLMMNAGVATVGVMFSPGITQAGNGYSLDGNVVFAGTPDNLSWDPTYNGITLDFSLGTTTRRGTLSFTPQPGLGELSYEIGVSILNSSGNVLSSDNCLVAVVS